MNNPILIFDTIESRIDNHDDLKKLNNISEEDILEIAQENLKDFKSYNITIKDFQHYKILSFCKKIIVPDDKIITLGEMTSGIVHDIKNPLSIIMSSFEILKADLIEEDIDIDDKYLNNIEIGVTAISNIVDGVLSFCRKDQQMERKFNFVELITKIEGFTNTFLMKKDIEFTLNYDKNVKKEFFDYIARDTMIAQAIFNLIKNSSDAIESLPSFSKWINLNLSKNTNFFEIEIVDGGKGIPQNIADKIFENFYTTKSEDKGTGIGLYFSKKVINEHGGDLFINQKSRNTSFIIQLPIKEDTNGRK